MEGSVREAVFLGKLVDYLVEAPRAPACGSRATGAASWHRARPSRLRCRSPSALRCRRRIHHRGRPGARGRQQRPVHHVRRAQPPRAGCLWQPARAHAQPRPPGRGRHPVRERLHQLPDLRAEPGELRHRPLRPPDRLLGQRLPLYRHAALLGPPPARQPATAATRSASCTIAAATDPNGFDNEILPLHVLDGKGDVQGMLRQPAAAPAEHGAAGRRCRGRPDAPISPTTAASAMPPSPGWSRRRKKPVRASPGACSSPSSARTSRSSPRRSSSPSTRSTSCRCRGCGTRPTSRTIRSCASCARSRTTRTISATRTMSASRSPPITAWSPSSTTISAGSWARSDGERARRATRSSSTRATTATISAPAPSGASRTCTRRRPACR